MSGCFERWSCFRLTTHATLALGWLLLVVAGCSRAFYRQQADREVYGLVECANRETRSSLDTIEPDPASRMFDPNNPDCPPMPPDDPTSHRLMRCVDGKWGWQGWDRYGRTRYVENPDWQLYLPRNEDGEIVLNREGAVEMALLQSPQYQAALEELYLSALQVSLERFRFDTQFFGGNSTFFTADGHDRSGAASSLLRTDTDLQMRKLFASGGELVVGLANSLVWQFAGPDTYSANTLLDFSLVQPLLRAGGRDIVLESLTDAERALLANVRQMERFRRGFYTEVVTGRGAGTTPSRGGIGIIRASGGAIRGAGGYLGLLEEQLRIRNRRANVAGLRESLERLETFAEGGKVTPYQVGLTRQGLYRTQSTLLSEIANYENRLDAYKISLGLPPQEKVRIEDSVPNEGDSLLSRFELIRPEMTRTQEEITAFLRHLRSADESRQVDPGADDLEALAILRERVATQVDAVRRDFESLLDVLPQRSTSLQRLAAREEFQRGDVDSTVVDVVELYLRVHELYSELEGIEAAQRLAVSLFECSYRLVLGEQGSEHAVENAIRLAEGLIRSCYELEDKPHERKMASATELARLLVDAFALAAGDEAAEVLNAHLQKVLLDLQKNKMGGIENIEEPEGRALEYAESRPGLTYQLRTTLDQVEAFGSVGPNAVVDGDSEAETPLRQLIDLVDRLSRQTLELSLIQAGARLDSIMLEPIELTSENALEIARENRRDWKNARAALVDAWRQITVVAEDLESDLDIVFSGDINTTDDNPVRFRGTTGRLRVGLEFDAPLTRLAERNAYRETLIEYQRARRRYYEFEDSVAGGLRETIRTVRLNELDFEVQRAAVLQAVDRVEQAQLSMERREQELGPNAGRDIVDALRDLLDAQNALLRIGVNQEALRINLEFDLGIMRLDERGMRVEPTPLEFTESARSEEGPLLMEAPMPEEIPLLVAP